MPDVTNGSPSDSAYRSPTLEVQTLTRRDRERLARSRAILDAALATFAEKGYEGATLDEVAERAEFGKGTLYNYFPGGKEEILFALFDEVYDGVVDLTNDYFDSEAFDRPTREVFRDFIARLIAHYLDSLPMFLLLIKEAHRLVFDEHERNVSRLCKQRERVAEAITAPVQRAMDRGELKKLDAHGVAHMLMGNVHGYLMYACPTIADAPSSSADAERGADFITSILFDGLLIDPE